jgi:hypothetical protein
MSLKTSLHGLVSFRVSAGQITRFVRPFISSSSLLASKGTLSYSSKQCCSRAPFDTDLRLYSEDTTPQTPQQEPNKAPGETPSNSKNEPPSPNKVKSVSQADKELRERLEQMSGEGGAAGIEYEDGKPNAMKRSVRNNMFRLI